MSNEQVAMSNERKQSKLDELIQQYCSDGVSFIPIKDLLKQKSICIITPSFKIKRNDYKESGSVPIISQEQEFISGYCERNDNNIPQKTTFVSEIIVNTSNMWTLHLYKVQMV